MGKIEVFLRMHSAKIEENQEEMGINKSTRYKIELSIEEYGKHSAQYRQVGKIIL